MMTFFGYIVSYIRCKPHTSHRTFYSRSEQKTNVIFFSVYISAAQILLVFLHLIREYFLAVSSQTMCTPNLRSGNLARNRARKDTVRQNQLYNTNFIQADARSYLLTGVQIPAKNALLFCEPPDSGTLLCSKKYGISLLINCLNEQKPNSNTRVWQTNKNRVN
jgi:hypothetical protein